MMTCRFQMLENHRHYSYLKMKCHNMFLYYYFITKKNIRTDGKGNKYTCCMRNTFTTLRLEKLEINNIAYICCLYMQQQRMKLLLQATIFLSKDKYVCLLFKNLSVKWMYYSCPISNPITSYVLSLLLSNTISPQLYS